MLVLAGLAAGLLASATTAGASPDRRATPALSPEAAAAACPGGLVAIAPSTPDAPPMCTHGPDPGVASTTADGVWPENATRSGIQCYGNGTDGARVQLIYAYAATNRFSTFLPWIEDRAAAVDEIFNESAAETGGERHIRWVTDADCNLNVRVLKVPAAAVALGGFNSLIATLVGEGLSSITRKYLVWADTGTSTGATSGTCFGIATVSLDERSNPAVNLSNTTAGYARVDDRCLFPLFNRVAGKVEAHELTHTLGAVQQRYVPTGTTIPWTVGAPHSSGALHCTDDYDVMCYRDDSGIQPQIACPDVNHELRLDCNHDDYFSTAPRADSYLDRHWNTADSSWLEAAPAPSQVPGAPTMLAAVPGAGQVTLNWSPPAFDGGEPVTAYRVFRDGEPIATVTARVTATATVAPATTYTDAGLVEGVDHVYRIAATNVIGEGRRTGAVIATAGVPRPDAQLSTSSAGPFQFGDVYASSMTGNGQVLNATVARGGTSTSYLRIENDRPATDSFKLKGVASGAAGYTVRYFRGTTDITAAVEAGTYTIADVPAGGHVDIKVKVKASTSAARASVRTVTLTVKSKTVASAKDVVQVRATRT